MGAKNAHPPLAYEMSPLTLRLLSATSSYLLQHESFTNTLAALVPPSSSLLSPQLASFGDPPRQPEVKSSLFASTEPNLSSLMVMAGTSQAALLSELTTLLGADLVKALPLRTEAECALNAPASIVDIARVSVAVSTSEELSRILSLILNAPTIKVLRLVNSFASENPYRFCSLSASLGEGAHVCEIQLHLAQLLALRNEAHEDFFQTTLPLSPGEQQLYLDAFQDLSLNAYNLADTIPSQISSILSSSSIPNLRALTLLASPPFLSSGKLLLVASIKLAAPLLARAKRHHPRKQEDMLDFYTALRLRGLAYKMLKNYYRAVEYVL
jgi:hypothetical protein